jgi:hypothetical protein
MRRETLVILGLLMAAVAVPHTAEARPRNLPGALFGFFTNPIGTIMNARHSGRRAHSRRAKAPRPSATAATQSKPAPTGAAVAGAAAAGAVAATAADQAGAAHQAGEANAATPSVASTAVDSAGDSASASALPVSTGESIPIPAPAQRNAALTAPSEPAAPAASPSGDNAQQPPAERGGKLGVVGPSSWPGAYEDVIGFTFWPQDYGARLRSHGIGDVLTATLAPTLLAPTVKATAANPSAATAEACGAAAPRSDWPAADLARAMDLNAEQRAALDRLQNTLTDTAASVRAAACRSRTASSPGERLHVLQNTLWTVHDAAVSLRAPLTKFYDTLNDNQKKQLAAAADPHGAKHDDIARVCGAPSANATPMRTFEQTLQPTKAQRAGLDAFQKKSFEMGQFLMASCLQSVAATPTERLDAAADRLTAVIFAASSVGLALNDVYNQLSDQQKAKLNGSGDQDMRQPAASERSDSQGR